MLLASWYLAYFFKQFRSLIAEILTSLGLMAPKLPVVKVGGLTKKSAIWPWPHSNQSAQVRGGPGSNHSQTLMAGNFAALWSTDAKFLAWKDLNFFKKYIKNQNTSSTLRVVFALSEWPHFHKDYLVTVCKQGRSHVFKSEGAQAAKIILGPFDLKNWEGPNLLLL